MKFKWYHAIIILFVLIITGSTALVMMGVLRRDKEAQATKAEQATMAKNNSKKDRDESSTRVKGDKSGQTDTRTVESATAQEGKTESDTREAYGNTTGDSTKTDVPSVQDTIVKALIVDHKTKSAKRMVKYLKRAGFEVTLVGSLDDFDVEDYDTLVIPGGHNITPSKYGAERQKETYGTNEEIDDLQIGAVNIFKDAEKPVLGVCRGCQLVNVALKGTINQHIPGWHKGYRRVKIDPKSWLYPRLGKSESVDHYHHQCVEKLGEGLEATQWDEEDGRIEGIQHKTLPIYGIQWHPDRMGDQGVDVFRYYKELVIDYKNKQNNKTEQNENNGTLQ